MTVSANAADNVGVAGVQFKLDGANLGAEDTASPYSASWNTTTATNGSHTLTAVARDAAGNTTTASIGHGDGDERHDRADGVGDVAGRRIDRVRDTVTVTASASDDVGVVGVQFKLDGAQSRRRGHRGAVPGAAGTRRSAPTAATR